MFREVSNTQEKVGNIVKNISNALKKVGNATEKVINGEQKVSNTFDKYMPLFREAEITDKFIKNIEQVFASCGTGVPFGQVNVQAFREGMTGESLHDEKKYRAENDTLRKHGAMPYYG